MGYTNQEKNRKRRRFLIPFLLSFFAAGIVTIMIVNKPPVKNIQETSKSTSEKIETKNSKSKPNNQIDLSQKTNIANIETKKQIFKESFWSNLQIKKHDEQEEIIETLGNLDPNEYPIEVTISSRGAGIKSVEFSDIWKTVQGKQKSKNIRKSGKSILSEPDLSDQRYTLQVEIKSSWKDENVEYKDEPITLFSAYAIEINDQLYKLTSPKSWEKIGKGKYQATIEDKVTKEPLITITRNWILGKNFDLILNQEIKNLTKNLLIARWIQYGPVSLFVDRSRYMDRRRFLYGTRIGTERDPNHLASVELDESKTSEYASLRDDINDAGGIKDLWSTNLIPDNKEHLVWFGSTNRYFGLAIHPLKNENNKTWRSLSGVAESIKGLTAGYSGSEGSEVVVTATFSPEIKIPGLTSHNLNHGVFAGPLERQTLQSNEIYNSLGLKNLILYQMSSMCAICTFQWLANGIVFYLDFIKDIVFDWGVAIILLVFTVRLLLHPITKKSQVSVQRFGKRMAAMRPDLEKAQKKYGGDPKKMQQEQVKLMREHGVNPLGALGCLPMFFQMPIWIALYAVLYFAFELRHMPAFYGVFQNFGGWGFLADLSAADHFFGEFEKPIELFGIWNITGLNLLPFLMGGIFYVQQKYMTPQNLSTSPEQQQTQKIMRIFMVLGFPLMLYSAPSGLTLYILTSTSIGILESRWVKKYVDSMEETNDKKNKKSKQDKMGKMYEKALQGKKKQIRRDNMNNHKSSKRRGKN